MIVYPRRAWTASVVKSNSVADGFTGLPYYRRHPVGIELYSSPFDMDFLELDPTKEFNSLLTEGFGSGHSDIDYNLGVSLNTSGVWSLRGLYNKSAASRDYLVNSAYVSVYLVIGKNERPTDQILRNILDARRLVLSRYPEASEVVIQSQNSYIRDLVPELLDSEVETEPVFDFPPAPLSVGMQSVHVQDLQELLAFWGYYKVRVDGVYNTQTVDAVTALSADLNEGEITGEYTEGLRQSFIHLCGQVRKLGVE